MNTLKEIEKAAKDLQAKCNDLEVEVNSLGHGGERAAAREAAERLHVLRGDLEHEKGKLAAAKEGHGIGTHIEHVPVAAGVVNQIRMLEIQLDEIGVFLDRTDARLNEIQA